MKGSKHQRKKQRCSSLCWKLPDGAQSFTNYDHKNIQQTNHSTSLTLKDGHGAEVTHRSLGVAVFDLIWFTFEG